MLKACQKGSERCLLGALILATSGCTAILDFSEPITKTDAAPIDATPQSDSIAAVCTTFEPNEVIADAKMITTTDVASAICSDSDTDLFRFDVIAGEDVIITLSFSPSGSDDLDLELLDNDGDLVIQSVGSDNSEKIERTAAQGSALAAGIYHIEVIATAVASTVPYSINLTITTPTPP